MRKLILVVCVLAVLVSYGVQGFANPISETNNSLYAARVAQSSQQFNGFGNTTSVAVTPEQAAFIWQPISFNVASGCLLSGCAGSLCIASGCVGSICVGSGCSSACGGSACATSGCAGSACPGSTCLGTGCLGSICVGSGCYGSICYNPNTCK